jgi:probable FeS assembly SUF system protein SufT
MHSNEPIRLLRDCDAIQIPSGQVIHLAAGVPVRVMQSAGTSYTIADDRGAMFRLDARDADALGLKAAPLEETPHAQSFSENMVWQQLKTVYDPEIPVNIVDLGLIYSATALPLEDGGQRVEVKMSMTAPGCGMADVLKADVTSKLSRLPDVKEVQVDVVFDPPWNPSMMSDAAKLQLGFDLDYGVPPSSPTPFNVLR